MPLGAQHGAIQRTAPGCCLHGVADAFLHASSRFAGWRRAAASAVAPSMHADVTHVQLLLMDGIQDAVMLVMLG